MTAAELSVLTHLRVTPLQILLRTTSPWQGPRWRAAQLRSALGFHLRQRECLTGAATCAGCNKAAECWYAYAFETPASLVSAERLQHADAHRPHPYYFAAPPCEGEVVPPGSVVPCLLTVLGEPAPILGRLLGALDLAGRSGRWGGGFRLERAVSAIDPQVWTDATGLAERAVTLPWPRWSVDDSSGLHAARLSTISPLRLRRQGQLIRQPAFADIVRALSRRLHLLAQSFAKVELPAGWAAGLVDTAQQIQTVRAQWQYAVEKRYSGRQKQEMPLDGVLGVLEVAGPLTPLRSYLDLARWIGVGSSTSFGFGALHLEIDE